MKPYPYICIFIAGIALSACSNKPLLKQSESPQADQCKRAAQQYVQTHRIDKFWRQHEFTQQYRSCMRNASAV